MKAFYWFLSFICLASSATIGVASTIGLINAGWVALSLVLIVALWQFAGLADSIKD